MKGSWICKFHCDEYLLRVRYLLRSLPMAWIITNKVHMLEHNYVTASVLSMKLFLLE